MKDKTTATSKISISILTAPVQYLVLITDSPQVLEAGKILPAITYRVILNKPSELTPLLKAAEHGRLAEVLSAKFKNNQAPTTEACFMELSKRELARFITEKILAFFEAGGTIERVQAGTSKALPKAPEFTLEQLFGADLKGIFLEGNLATTKQGAKA